MIVSALYTGISGHLNGRPVTSLNNTAAEYIRKSILEYTEDYKFPGLEATGPVINLIPLQANYNPSYFLGPSDILLPVNKVDSFFLFNNGYSPLTQAIQQNSGYNLTYATVNNIEVLINTPGIPTKWTRYNDQVWVGDVPDNTYPVQMRYQKEHPFPNAGGANAGNDPILLPDSWQDIIEITAAMRAARDLNLTTKANELLQILNGDAQFQKTGGVQGAPGLVFGRTSQRERDQKTFVKSMKLRMGVQR